MTESRYFLRSTRHDTIRASQHASNYPGNSRALCALTLCILHAKCVQDSTEPQWILLSVSQKTNLATLLIDNQQDLQALTLQLALCRPRISAAKRDPVMPQQGRQGVCLGGTVMPWENEFRYRTFLRKHVLSFFSFCAGISQGAVGSPSHGQSEKCRGAETKSMRPDMDRLMEMTFERNR